MVLEDAQILKVHKVIIRQQVLSVLIIVLVVHAERKAGRNTLMFLIGKTMALTLDAWLS